MPPKPFRRRRKRGKKGTFAKKVLKVINNVFEPKEYSASVNFTATPASVATYNWANALSTGTTAGDRIGNEIRMKSFDLNFVIQPPVGIVNVGTLPSQAVRLIILLNKQNITPSIAAVLESVSDANACVSTYDKLYRQRFNILFDRSWVISNHAYEKGYVKKRIHINLKNKLVKYTASPPAIGDLQCNSLVWYLLTDETTAASRPVMLGNYKFMFHDA